MTRAGIALMIAAGLLAGCGRSLGGQAPGGRISVVAAEGFWGSIAAELGGNRVSVKSVVSNPATDPHDYEPTAADGRAFAGAEVAVVNGAGYDAWASKLLAANPVAGRAVVNVARLTGVHAGANPHLWYSPRDVSRAIAAVTAAYKHVDARHARYFDERRRWYETQGLASYRRLIASIRQRFAGAPVGASESIFARLAPALGLRLETPRRFLDAISEGTDPTAGDKRAVDRQIATRAIRVWVFNRQNASPDVRRLTAAARRVGSPVVAITETPVPARTTFQAWQVHQLEALRSALAQATRR